MHYCVVQILVMYAMDIGGQTRHRLLPLTAMDVDISPAKRRRPSTAFLTSLWLLSLGSHQ